MELSHAITKVENGIRQLEISYRRFLAGDAEMRKPPVELEEQIAREIKRLQGLKMSSSVDRYRLSNVEARFHSYREMYGRRVREHEEGRVPQRRPSGETERPSFDPERGVIVGAGPAHDASRALFEGLYERSGRSMKMDLDSFRSYLTSQVASIQSKTGCESVQFRLVNEGGKVKLKAKPIGGR